MPSFYAVAVDGVVVLGKQMKKNRSKSRWLIGKVFVWILRRKRGRENVIKTMWSDKSRQCDTDRVSVSFLHIFAQLSANDWTTIWHSYSHWHQFTHTKAFNSRHFIWLPFTLSLSFAFYEYQLNYEYLDTFNFPNVLRNTPQKWVQKRVGGVESERVRMANV